MITYIFYGIFLLYVVVLLVSLISYLIKPPPSGDASVGWALGIIYTAVLAGILMLVWFLRKYPGAGVVILCFPILFLALPRIRYAFTNLYARLPTGSHIPPLILRIENNTPAKVHVKLECWFGKAKSHSAQLYRTLDYHMGPMEKSDFPLTVLETRLLAEKSKYVGIKIFEQVEEQYEGRSFNLEIQPCMQFYEEQIIAFRSGTYTLVIDAAKNTDSFMREIGFLKEQKRYQQGVF